MQFDAEQIWIVSIIAALLILERVIPRARLFLLSAEARENIIWLILNKSLSLLGVGAFIYMVNTAASQYVPFAVNLSGAHWMVQFLSFFILSDLVSYLGHRALHTWKPLWRFHVLHHSSKELTTLSAFRHHWFEEIFFGVNLGVLTSFLHISNSPKVIVFMMIGAVCYFQHSNLNLKFQEIWNYLFVTPLNHRWHHSTEMVHPKGQNFGLFLSIWDRMFGSYYVPAFEPHELGVKEQYPDGIWARVIYPFFRKS